MLIRPELRALPDASVHDEYFETLQKKLSDGAAIRKVVFRIAGTPRAGEPKMDFHLATGEQESVVTVMYGPRTRHLLETGNIPVENV
jgi:hypothetical protein